MRVLTLAALALSLALSAAAAPPNVILILADDQGTLDLNVYGSKDLHTPNLDRLAGEGVRFTQFYVGAPVCSPSRASLLTGRFPQRAGVPGNVGLGKEGMPSAQITIAEVLAKAGYDTRIFGKWHLGEVNGGGPLDQGFQKFYGFKRGCIDNFSHFFYWSGPNDHDLWCDRTEVWEEGTYFPGIIVREVKEFLAADHDNPFFIYVPFNIPHYPLQGSKKWREYYESNGRREAMADNRFHYAALVSTLDEQVGEILTEVDRQGLRENTLIVFLSDHGHSTEERAMFGGGNAGPYRGAKFSLFEGGIRVPSLARLPGVIEPGSVRDQLATSLDWLPTISDLADAPLPAGHRIDGRSLLPVLRNAQAPSAHGDVFYWQLSDQWAVRKGDWKLIVNGHDTDRSPLEGRDKVFLSNLRQDPGERRNFAADHGEIVRELEAMHEAWAGDLKP